MSRHPFDPVSFVAGLVFVAVAVGYLFEAHSNIDVDGRWVLPLALIGLGIGGVMGALSTAARQRREPASSISESSVDGPVGRSD